MQHLAEESNGFVRRSHVDWMALCIPKTRIPGIQIKQTSLKATKSYQNHESCLHQWSENRNMLNSSWNYDSNDSTIPGMAFPIVFLPIFLHQTTAPRNVPGTPGRGVHLRCVERWGCHGMPQNGWLKMMENADSIDIHWLFSIKIHQYWSISMTQDSSGSVRASYFSDELLGLLSPTHVLASIPP